MMLFVKSTVTWRFKCLDHFASPLSMMLLVKNTETWRKGYLENSTYPLHRRLRLFCPSQPRLTVRVSLFSTYPLSPRRREVLSFFFRAGANVTCNAQPSIRDRSLQERRHEIYTIDAAIHPNGLIMGIAPEAQSGSSRVSSQSPSPFCKSLFSCFDFFLRFLR